MSVTYFISIKIMLHFYMYVHTSKPFKPFDFVK